MDKLLLIKQQTQQVFLNSKYATTYNNGTHHSDVTFYLTRPITRPPNTVLALRLLSFTFPVSWTNINEDNNTLVIDWGGGDQTYTIPEGDYNVDTLKEALNTLLNPLDVTVTFNETNLKFTFEETNASDFTIRSTSTCLLLLGFTEDVDHTTTLAEITSTMVVNLSNPIIIYVSVPNLSINNLNASTGQRVPVLTGVPLYANNSLINTYDNLKQSYVYLQEDTINSLQIRLLKDDLATLVKFGGANWHMSLEFSFLGTP